MARQDKLSNPKLPNELENKPPVVKGVKEIALSTPDVVDQTAGSLSNELESEERQFDDARPLTATDYVAYTIKLPNHQLAALQSIWLELKRAYGANSPDKSGMIQQAVDEWLKRWDGQERSSLLNGLLAIREDTRRRQFRKFD